ncbi:cytochrome P450 [Mycena galopus ATCC 62051]|nr:cytochrome P450 [Mycena galopus ATCC 62051]
MLLKLLISISGSLGVYGLYELLKVVYGELRSPIRLLPGPKSTHWFYGNLREIFKAENSVLHEKWVEEYGPTIKYKIFLGKPESARFALARMLGRGVLVAEGEEHRQQVDPKNPAFGAPQIRELTEIFVEKSLRDIWAGQVANSDGAARVDILSWLSKTTLDVIGLAGRLNSTFVPNEMLTCIELGAAFATIFESGMSRNFISVLQTFIPAFRFIPTKLDTTMKASQATMIRIGRKLIEESRKEMAESGTFEKSRARDLLSLLVRANTSKDIPANQRLSDEDVLAQVPTFLVAGHESEPCTATTWALFALTQNVAAQKRLRDELLTVSTDNPTMDQLNELSYLDMCVRETLRVHAPVASTMRVATQDDVVPLATPFKDINGTVHDTLRINKGQTIMIPILALNRDKATWGPDAMEFIPERWEGTVSNSIPGVWGHMLSFLGGPRACIGYRFSLVEMKALLFTLVRAFEFELAVPVTDIEKKTAVVQRPLLKSDPKAGNQMPLIIKPCIRS